jgi:hypothetical protein
MRSSQGRAADQSTRRVAWPSRSHRELLSTISTAERTGVKDLDVWTFYAAIPGERFPGDKRVRRADFRLSSLGRQAYDLDAARDARQRAMWRRWSAYTGRRVDFCLRVLPIQADVPINSVISTLQEWLARGAKSRAKRKPSPWYLAQKAVVLLYPTRIAATLFGHPAADQLL